MRALLTAVFDRKLGSIPPIADGEVILIKGLLSRKVLASETDGDEVAVLTVPAGGAVGGLTM